MIVDDPYMVRIEAIQQLGGMGSDFRKLTEAWMPKGDAPSLRDLMAMAALAQIACASDVSQADDTAHRAYIFADAMMKARKV